MKPPRQPLRTRDFAMSLQREGRPSAFVKGRPFPRRRALRSLGQLRPGEQRLDRLPGRIDPRGRRQERNLFGRNLEVLDLGKSRALPGAPQAATLFGIQRTAEVTNREAPLADLENRPEGNLRSTRLIAPALILDPVDGPVFSLHAPINSNPRATIPCPVSCAHHNIWYFYLTQRSSRSYPRRQHWRFLRITLEGARVV